MTTPATAPPWELVLVPLPEAFAAGAAAALAAGFLAAGFCVTGAFLAGVLAAVFGEGEVFFCAGGVTGVAGAF